VHVLHPAVVLAVVLVYTVLKDRKLLAAADYGLLLTFTFFFIFVGNIKNIPTISIWISSIVSGKELVTGILLSQIISNVPSAMLLSGFKQIMFRCCLVSIWADWVPSLPQWQV